MIPLKEELQNYIDNRIPQWKIKDFYGVSQGTVSHWFSKYHLKSKIKTGGAKNIKNLIGKRYGKLTVIDFAYADTYGKNYLCKCDCGNEKIFRGSTLTSGKITGCGCGVGKNNKGKTHKEYAMSHIGEKYSRLEIIDIEKSSHDLQNDYMMICKCDCGNTTKQRYADIVSGKVKSCGCYNKEIASINGSTIGLNNYKKSYHWYFIKNEKQIHCRSGYEVIYANYLIKNDIAFEYEPKCFKLDNGKRYTPDFYVINSDEWIEIKGSFKMNNSHQKENAIIFSKTHTLIILHWNDIVDVCSLPYKSYNTFLNHADRKSISREDYLAHNLYQKYDE